MSSIAIVGRSCLLPEALTIDSFWNILCGGQDVLTSASPDAVNISGEALKEAASDQNEIPHLIGGYVKGFDTVFDPDGFQLSSSEMMRASEADQWVAHTARACIRDAGLDDPVRSGLLKTSLILGNLSLPTPEFSRFCESVWEGKNPGNSARFMSGSPALFAAQALGLSGPAFSLDAACASSLYGISRACDLLQTGEATFVLAGALNHADQLFLHGGFHQLQALSLSGLSKPLQSDGDGLVPSEGAAFIGLMRHEDAMKLGCPVLGIISGIGLSNDGKSKGFLVPSPEGQVLAMKRAYDQAKIRPEAIRYLECHATGTPTGDGAEIQAIRQVFEGAPLRAGSLKGHMGHLITVSGMASVLKIIEIFRRKQIPPTLHWQNPLPEVSGAGLQISSDIQAWSGDDQFAAVSAFGFGGNNAHLILKAPGHESESSDPATFNGSVQGGTTKTTPGPDRPHKAALIGVELRVGGSENLADFLNSGKPEKNTGGPKVDPLQGTIDLDLSKTASPPNDLNAALPQQLLIAELALNLTEQGVTFDPAKTGVFAGMETHPDVARYGQRWRKGDKSICQPLSASGVIGTLPNIVANRLNRMFEITGSGLTISSEQLSGLDALSWAINDIEIGKLESAVVAAVDFSCDPVHIQALFNRDGEESRVSDGAVVLVLKSLDAAQKNQDNILGVFEAVHDQSILSGPDDTRKISEIKSGAFAASGLLDLTEELLIPCEDGRKRSIRFMQKNRPDRVWSVEFSPLSRPARQVSRSAKSGQHKMSFPGHWPLVPAIAKQPEKTKGTHVNHSNDDKDTDYQMAPAPWLPSVYSGHNLMDLGPDNEKLLTKNAETVRSEGSAQQQKTEILTESVSQYYERMSQAHKQFLTCQSDSYQSFMSSHSNKLEIMINLLRNDYDLMTDSSLSECLTQDFQIPVMNLPDNFDHRDQNLADFETESDVETVSDLKNYSKHSEDVARFDKSEKTEGADTLNPVEPVDSNGLNDLYDKAIQFENAASDPKPDLSDEEAPEPEDVSLSREQLVLHSQGPVSEVFGDKFKDIDLFRRVVRMPQPPLLLADRVVSMTGVSRSLGVGRVLTETDVKEGEIYEYRGHFLPGLLVEAGQADLLLISWLGIDFLNKGEKVYRLLGCELSYHGDLPAVGDTLRFDIHLDRHVEHQDTRLFFFHSDCIDAETGRTVLTVRNGQAGFFTDKELSSPGGIIWDASKELAQDESRPLVRNHLPSGEQIFAEDQVQLFSEGKIWECFGKGYERAASHHMSPGIPGGKMLLFDRVSSCNIKGGPLQRGYIRAEFDINPERWFFEGHFKDDPCMPGTMMLDGCFQVMAFYMAYTGMTLNRDGWRFKPVSEKTYRLKCRGQVTPRTKKLSYEIYVRESEDQGRVCLVADVMCQVDGLNAFHAQELALELVPDWPAVSAISEDDPSVEGLSFPLSIEASRLGKPSQAFGPNYSVFDQGMRVARLPAPPLCCVSRVLKFEGEAFKLVPGAELTSDFSFDSSDWFCEPSGWGELPFGILLEVALQGCGVLASLAGSALRSDQELFFRNLDGKGKILKPVRSDAGPVTTRVTLTKVSGIAEILIEGFKIICMQNQQMVAEFESEFGFFPAEALEKQAGLPQLPDRERYLDLDSPTRINLPLRSELSPLSMPSSQLLMSDRITGFWPEAGRSGLGIIRSEKDVEPTDWYFKAHFFQDPVQPGSLGLEGMVQLVQWYALEKKFPETMVRPVWSLVSEQQEVLWKYRGQVRPENQLVKTIVEILQIEQMQNSIRIHAKGSLWCDGVRIYEAASLYLNLFDDDPEGAKHTVALQEGETNSPDSKEESQPLSEQVPSELSGPGNVSNEKVIFFESENDSEVLKSYSGIGWAVPLLTLPEVLGKTLLKVRSSEYPWSLQGTGLRNFFLNPGIARDQIKACKVSISNINFPGESHARKVSLVHDEISIGEGILFRGGKKAGGAALPESKGEWGPGAEFLNKCELSGEVSELVSYRSGQNELSLKIKSGQEQDDQSRLMKILNVCFLSQPVLNADKFYQNLNKSMSLAPYKIHAMDIFQVIPKDAELECVSRLVGSLGSQNEPVFLMQLVHSGGDGQRVVLVEWQLVCKSFPVTIVDQWERDKKSSFIDGAFVAGLGLSRKYDTETRLDSSALDDLDRVAGSVESVWGRPDLATILQKEHQSYGEKIHPKLLPDCLPLTRFSNLVIRDNDDLLIRSAYKSELNVEKVVSYWNETFGEESWLVGDLLTGLLGKFVRRLIYTHDGLIKALDKRGVLYFANHQVGIESFLFAAIQSAMSKVPVHVIAKSEHQSSWLGGFIEDIYSVPGCELETPMILFDRHRPSEFPELLAMQGQYVLNGEKSLLIHVEGTRGLSEKERVRKISQILPEFQQTYQCDMIPVQFSGGLPERPVEKRLEFPFAMGKQDYRLGSPVVPGMLANLNLLEKKDFLSRSINDSHPGIGHFPGETDEVFARKVHSWMLESGASLENSVLFCILQEMRENSESLSEETLAVLDCKNGNIFDYQGDENRINWLKPFAKKLLGRKYKD